MHRVPPVSSCNVPLPLVEDAPLRDILRHWHPVPWRTAAPANAVGQFGFLVRITLVGFAILILSVCGRPADAQVIETVYGWMNEGYESKSGLVQGSDGNFYGTTESGGIRSNGAVFRMSAAGEYTVLHYFSGRNTDIPRKEGDSEGDDGKNPNSRLILGRDGNLYGTTMYGGVKGGGTIFRISPSGEYSLFRSFSSADGVGPAGVVQGSDGYLYGATAGGGENGKGTIFRISSSGEFTVLHSFTAPDGFYAEAKLVQGADGHFYGTTSLGGENGRGTFFRISAAGQYTVLHSFRNTDGIIRSAELVQGSGGYFYGVATYGGESSKGVVFRISAAGEFTILHSFSGMDGIYPSSGLLHAHDGYLYGTTAAGGAGDKGTIFRIGETGELVLIYTFDGVDGRAPIAGLVQGSDGYLYGTTISGEIDPYGVIFRVGTTGEDYTVLHSFSRDSSTRIMQGSDGCFYGTTQSGGTRGCGSVFRISTTGGYTVLHSFNRLDGSLPLAELVQGNDGYFYGTSSYGGANGKGTIFRVSATGEHVVLHSFSESDGSYPYARLVQGIDGYFYGTTASGGTNGRGVVFRISAAGELVVIHSFDGSHGSYPYAGVVQGNDGYFYGSAVSGGIDNNGVIFRVSTVGEYSVLHYFDGSDGDSPEAELLKGSDGSFYGTAGHGGIAYNGVVFRISTAGEYKVLHYFSGSDGWHPRARLVQGIDDRFYGTTDHGGAGGYGTIFRISPVGDYAVLHSFGGTGGQYPQSAPIIGNDGNLWGTTSSDSTYSAGILYRLQLEPVTLPADRITYSSGILHAKVARRSGVMVQFEYGTDPTLAASVSTDLVPLPGGSNAVVISAQLSNLEPGTIYYYRTGVRSADGAIQLGEILSFTTGLAESQTNVLATKGAAVPGAGTPDSGIPSGAAWKNFGVPALAGTSHVAFGAKLKLPTGTSLTGIFVGEAAAPVLVLKQGDAAAGLPDGSIFSSLKDPLLNSAGEVAFIGTVSAGGKKKQGIWSNAGVLSGKPEWLVALQGAEAAGIPGSRWKAFTSVVLSDSGVISFTATLEQGRGGVTSANDLGLWRANPSGTLLLLREGQELVLDGVTRKVKSFVALSSEQGRPTADGKLPVKVTFTDNTKVLLQFRADNTEPEVIAASGDVVSEAGGALFRSFGVPTLNESGIAAFAATLVGGTANVDSSNDTGIFITREDNWGVIARQGDMAPGVMWKGTPGKFVSFADPLINAEGQVVFMGTATGGAKGIWWSGGAGEELQLVASTMTEVPGVDEARFAAFKSVALPNGTLAGPLFVAKLEGKGITPSNDVGLWAVDSEGVPRLIVREGDTVDGKVLRSFTFLSAVPGSAAQPRSYDGQRQLIYRAFFIDGSQSLVTVRLP